VPFEVLTDNGKQFTGRHIRPQPVEVLFERVCRENGILQRQTKPRSPTTTGKIERFHKTLRAELLDHVLPFGSLEAAQAAIDGWVHAYNHQRPHQALEMAVPASKFRPNGPAQEIAVPAPTAQDDQVALPWADAGIVAPPPLPVPRSAAVEFEARVAPGGHLAMVRAAYEETRTAIPHQVSSWLRAAEAEMAAAAGEESACRHALDGAAQEISYGAASEEAASR
jgi:integrase-like protein